MFDGARVPAGTTIALAVGDPAPLAAALKEAAPGVVVHPDVDVGDPSLVDAIICWEPPDLSRFPKLRMVQSSGAGVDRLVRLADRAPDVPICRIVDPGMAAGMAAYVCWAVTHRHRGMSRYLEQARERRWIEHPVVRPADHVVGIAGLGVMGKACVEALRAIGYPTRGWSRGSGAVDRREPDRFVGDAQLGAFLSGCATLVCLLPLTPATRGFLCRTLFARLPRGAHVVNVGRGEHLVEADLLDALASGHLGGATLDTVATEPLPAEHPFWSEPDVTVTPHIATRPHPRVVAEQTVANLASVLNGTRPLGQVEVERGY